MTENFHICAIFINFVSILVVCVCNYLKVNGERIV
jgi:hypothetical protein